MGCTAGWKSQALAVDLIEVNKPDLHKAFLGGSTLSPDSALESLEELLKLLTYQSHHRLITVIAPRR
jgi:hypothetical protein